MKIKINKKYILLIFLILLFIIDLILVISNMTVGFDTAVYNTIRSINNEFFDTFFKVITTFCDPIILILLLAIIFINLNKKYGKNLLSIIVFGSVVNFIIKNIIGRERPSVLRLVDAGGYSFPSAHSMISVMFYGYLIYIINKKISNKMLRNSLEILLSVLILFICVSRIYVGVHFASDVIGGMILGLALLMLYILLCKKLGGEKSV